jgi:uncharacterized membrane protein
VPLNAFILVAIAALAHSTWNLLAKRAAQSKHVIWFSSIAESVLFLPVAVWVTRTSTAPLNFKAAVFLFATGFLHILYFEALQRGYRVGDLSVVYPLARGTGPLLAFFGAIVALGERPSVVAVPGALMITGGVFLLSGGFSVNRAGLLWGMATGATIACYTLTDGYSVKVLLLSPFLVQYAGTIFRLVVFSARGWRERAAIPSEARLYWREALGIAVLLPMGYVLVLFAMRFAPVSHVAPIREMSMLIAAWFGARLLHERDMARRVTGSLLVAAGVAALALG